MTIVPTSYAMDERMLLDARTGVATYARALEQALKSIAGLPVRICDRDDPGATLRLRSGRTSRWVRALWPGTRRANPTFDASLGSERLGSERVIIRDLFRLAQVHFDIWGGPLPVRLPGPSGIVHWTYPLPIRVVGWRNIYTVHDAIPLLMPALTPVDGARHRRLLLSLARGASAFATVSASARNEIAAALKIHPARVVDCGQGVSTDPPSPGPLPGGLAPRGYLLVVGAVETRKNIPAIVAAHRRSGIELPLVIAGPDGWGAEAIAVALNGPSLLRLTYLPEGELRRLIAQARALVMVSQAEGFGLPIAEAMALGTPVITADNGAQAETAGDAALLVPPDDEEALAAAMRRIVGDEALWHLLVDRGARRAKAFSPARLAMRLRDLYAALPSDGSALGSSLM